MIRWVVEDQSAMDLVNLELRDIQSQQEWDHNEGSYPRTCLYRDVVRLHGPVNPLLLNTTFHLSHYILECNCGDLCQLYI